MLTSNISVNLLDVLLYKENASKTVNGARGYSALSYRIDSDSEFHVRKLKIPAVTDSIAFVPGSTEYIRTTKKEEAIVFHFEMFGNADSVIEVFTPSSPDEYKKLFLRALDIWEKKETGFKYKATAVFYEILARMQSDGEIKETGAIRGGERTALSAKEQMDLHFSDPELDISKIAAALFVSESYLRRVFAKKFGMSPKKYLDDVRISHARALIDARIFSQKEVARRCGFGDVKYFRTVFKKKAGVTPSAYKYSFRSKNRVT